MAGSPQRESVDVRNSVLGSKFLTGVCVCVRPPGVLNYKDMEESGSPDSACAHVSMYAHACVCTCLSMYMHVCVYAGLHGVCVCVCVYVGLHDVFVCV